MVTSDDAGAKIETRWRSELALFGPGPVLDSLEILVKEVRPRPVESLGFGRREYDQMLTELREKIVGGRRLNAPHPDPLPIALWLPEVVAPVRALQSQTPGRPARDNIVLATLRARYLQLEIRDGWRFNINQQLAALIRGSFLSAWSIKLGVDPEDELVVRVPPGCPRVSTLVRNGRAEYLLPVLEFSVAERRIDAGRAAMAELRSRGFIGHEAVARPVGNHPRGAAYISYWLYAGALFELAGKDPLMRRRVRTRLAKVPNGGSIGMLVDTAWALLPEEPGPDRWATLCAAFDAVGLTDNLDVNTVAD